MTGKILASYHLSRLALHDVVVTPDGQRLLGVATLIESPDGLQPHKARKEKRIVGMLGFNFNTSFFDVIHDSNLSSPVYNLAHKVIER